MRGVGGGMEGRGRLPSQEDEERVALSGKATAGDAPGAGGARGASPPTGPVLAPGTLYPQTLREQMPSSLFPEGVGWGEAGDSVLMGTGCGVGCLCCSRSEGWGVGVRCSGSLWALGSR